MNRESVGARGRHAANGSEQLLGGEHAAFQGRGKT